MSLIATCMNIDLSGMAACLVEPGSGALPGGPWGELPAANCMDFDRPGMIECLTGANEDCCYVLGANGCVLLVNGEPITNF